MSDDPALSPSIPDPSDERGRFRLDPPDMYGRMHLYDSGTPIAHLTVGFPGMPDDSADALRVLLAARPTSLPEAPEPDDEWNAAQTTPRRVVIYRNHHHVGSAVFEWESDADAFHAAINADRATPSAPPVAVDPEARAGERVWVPKAEFDALDEVLTGPAGEDGDADNEAVTYFAAQLVAAHRLANRPAAASGGDGEGTGNDG